MTTYNTAARQRQDDDLNTDVETGRGPRRCVLPSGERAFIVQDAVRPPRGHDPLKRKRKAWSPHRVIEQANRYLSDVEKTVRGRHHGPCDTDDGGIYYQAAVELRCARYMAIDMAGKKPSPVDSFGWAQAWTPRLAMEHPRGWFEEQERRIIEAFGAKPPSVPSADAMAQALQTTHAEVIAFELVSVVGTDRPARQRRAERKAKKATGERRRRTDAGAIPHTESMAQAKPWESYGISASTFRRWVREGRVPPHPTQRAARKQAKNTPRLRVVKSA